MGSNRLNVKSKGREPGAPKKEPAAKSSSPEQDMRSPNRKTKRPKTMAKGVVGGVVMPGRKNY